MPTAGVRPLGSSGASWSSGDGGRGPENAFEARLLDLLVAHGLPRPECGVEVVAGGRRYRIDLAYPPPWRFTWRRLQDQPEAVVAEVRRALDHPPAARLRPGTGCSSGRQDQ